MLRSKSRAIFSLSLLTLALMVTPAYSTTITTYSSLASWQAAASGLQTINFDGIAPAGSYTTYPAISGYSQSGVQFIGLTGSTIGIMDTTAYTWANFGTNGAGFALASTPSFRIILPAGVTAFGINLFNSSDAPSSYAATVLGTPFTAPTFNQPTLAFFGVTSDTPIPSVDLTLSGGGGQYGFFDNFQWGTAQATGQVPEAGTFLLIGSGLIGLTIFRKRGNRRKPRASDAG
jgi:hypothetical protein